MRTRSARVFQGNSSLATATSERGEWYEERRKERDVGVYWPWSLQHLEGWRRRRRRRQWRAVETAEAVKYQAPISAFVCPAPEEAISSLRMAKAAFTLHAAYVHSYAMPVFMYHLCGVPARKSCAFGRRKRCRAFSRIPRAMLLFVLIKTWYLCISKHERPFIEINRSILLITPICEFTLWIIAWNRLNEQKVRLKQNVF